MIFFGLTDLPANVDADALVCRHCGSSIRVTKGGCVNCLLKSALEGEGIDSGSFAAALAAIDPRDLDWRIGNYQILEEIGRGGMGVIYRARQRHSGRIVALKRVLSYHADSRETLARFRREAEAAAGLDHPNILPIYEVGETEDHLPFFSMKFAVRGTLLEIKRTLRNDRREIVRLVSKVTRAVQFAHSQGILHRDLKPGNILLDSRGEPLVSDFGLAKWLDTSSDLTRTLTIFGTPGYIAPEQASGPAANLKPTADVYSIGAILFDLFTGRPPFLGEHALAVIKQAADMSAPKLRSVVPDADRDLETVCAKCLEREPSARYQSAQDLAADLELWLEGRPIVARPVPPAVRVWRWSKRNPKLATSLTGCLLLAGIAATWQLKESHLASDIKNRNLLDQSIGILPALDLDVVSTASPDSDLINSICLNFSKAAGRLTRVSSIPNLPRDYSSEARRLGVRYLLIGTTRRTAEGQRYALHWFDARAGKITQRVIGVTPLNQRHDVEQSISHLLAGAAMPPASSEAENFGTDSEAARNYLIAGEEYYARLTREGIEEAIRCARKAIAADPSCAAGYRLLANSLGMRDNYVVGGSATLAEASAAANKATELAPDSAAAAFATIGINLRTGKLNQALDGVYRTIELGLDFRRPAVLAAMIYKWQGEPDLALRWIQFGKEFSQRPGEDLSFEASILADLGADAEAEAAYQQSMDLLPDLPDGMLGLAELRLVQGDFVRARELSDSLSEKFPSHVYAAEFAAQLAFYSGDFNRAADLLHRLFDADNDGPTKFYGSLTFASGRGFALCKLGRRAEGRRLLMQAAQSDRKALQSAPEDGDRLYDLAATHAALEAKQEAISELRQLAPIGAPLYRFLLIDPRFEGIRETAEFKQILNSMFTRLESFRTVTSHRLSDKN
jgi:serine/threonine protein kinase/Flp pilus assembly protein TadD